MAKDIFKNLKMGKVEQNHRFWGRAARLEHINVRNKKKGKKRFER